MAEITLNEGIRKKLIFELEVNHYGGERHEWLLLCNGAKEYKGKINIDFLFNKFGIQSRLFCLQTIDTCIQIFQKYPVHKCWSSEEKLKKNSMLKLLTTICNSRPCANNYFN